MVAEKGALTYTEIKQLDVYEFFMILTNYEQQNGDDRFKNKR